MHLITSPNSFDFSSSHCTGTCITIGNFDGVHVGHQSLLRRTLEKSAQKQLMPTVVTFSPHPLAVLAGVRAPSLITPQQERIRLFALHGIELTLELPFNREIAALSPEEFVKHVLVPLNCRHLVIGYDFSLGKNRAGNVDVLRTLGIKYGFDVEQIPPVIVLDAVVSSTRVRDLIRAGEVWDVQALLGRYFTLTGTVVHGHGRGSGLGFPTANIQTQYATLPRQGVYATWIEITNISAQSHIQSDKNCPTPEAKSTFPAVTNIGFAPTFENNELSIESFLLEGKHNMYGKDISLAFVQRIRDEQRFSNVDELTLRISKDVELAHSLLDFAPQP